MSFGKIKRGSENRVNTANVDSVPDYVRREWVGGNVRVDPNIVRDAGGNLIIKKVKLNFDKIMK